MIVSSGLISTSGDSGLNLMQDLAEKIPGSDALEAFCGKDASEREFTDDCRSILEVTASTGQYWHDWSKLKCLISFRLAQVMQEYLESQMKVDGSDADLVLGEKFSDLLDGLLQGLDSFITGAPFTSQRLCELLLDPQKSYVNLDKLSLAFQKLILVTSTDPVSTKPYPSKVQPSANNVESPEKEQLANEIPSDESPCNMSSTVNGSHEESEKQEIVDDVMTDVERVVDEQLTVEPNGPVSERPASPIAESSNAEPEVSDGKN